MNFRDIDLNLLAAFEALMTERQVTRAAQRMGVGQPAMSDALRRLRALFGDPLMVRAAAGMVPTPKALALAGDIAPLLARLRQVMGAEVAFAPDTAAATFTLASTDYTTLVLLPPLMAALRVEAPGIDLRVRGYEKDEIGGLLERGEIDVALGRFADPPPGAVQTVLFRERFVGLARVGHPALAGGGMDLAAFASAAHALVSVRADARGAVDAALAEVGLRRRVALVVPYMLLLPRVLEGSDLIVTLPERAARLTLGMIPFDLPVAVPDWTVEMLWNPASRTDRATGWLRQMLVRVAGAV
jgi:DNA-binding transcriptional LysR family regulator